jgi:hypothetical protein
MRSGELAAKHSFAALLLLSALVAAGLIGMSMELYTLSKRASDNALQHDFDRYAQSAFFGIDEKFRRLLEGSTDVVLP